LWRGGVRQRRPEPDRRGVDISASIRAVQRARGGYTRRQTSRPKSPPLQSRGQNVILRRSAARRATSRSAVRRPRTTEPTASTTHGRATALRRRGQSTEKGSARLHGAGARSMSSMVGTKNLIITKGSAEIDMQSQGGAYCQLAAIKNRTIVNTQSLQLRLDAGLATRTSVQPGSRELPDEWNASSCRAGCGDQVGVRGWAFPCRRPPAPGRRLSSSRAKSTPP